MKKICLSRLESVGFENFIPYYNKEYKRIYDSIHNGISPLWNVRNDIESNFHFKYQVRVYIYNKALNKMPKITIV